MVRRKIVHSRNARALRLNTRIPHTLTWRAVCGSKVPCMSPRLFRHPRTASSTAEFLADREGLSGTVRQHFLKLLDEYGGFRAPPRRRHLRLLFLVSLAAFIGVLICDRRGESLKNIAVWVGSLGLAGYSLWNVHRLERCRPLRDNETEWRAYCRYLRPIILVDRPGLLDRNNPTVYRDGEPDAEKRLIPLLTTLVRARGIDFWCSCIAGLWAGLLVALLVRRFWLESEVSWTALLPFGGYLIGPVLWSAWHVVVIQLARRDPRSDDE